MCVLAGDEPDVEIYNASAYVNLTGTATIELRDPSGTLIVYSLQWQGSLQPLCSYYNSMVVQ